MKKKPTRKAPPPPPLSAQERQREEARRMLKRSLARDKQIRALTRQLGTLVHRRNTELLDLAVFIANELNAVQRGEVLDRIAYAPGSGSDPKILERRRAVEEALEGAQS